MVPEQGPGGRECSPGRGAAPAITHKSGPEGYLAVIITRTPLRISFAGGGTDLPSFYRTHGGGAVTSAAIDRYVHVLVNEKFDKSIRVAYSRTENVDHLEDLQHPIFKEAMRATGVLEALEIHTIADVPGEGTGLGRRPPSRSVS